MIHPALGKYCERPSFWPACLVLAAASAGPSAVAQVIDLQFTHPKCALQRYVLPVKDGTGATLKSKPENVYCVSSDRDRPENELLLQRFRNVFTPTDRKILAVRVYAYSFSDGLLLNAICEAAVNGASVTMVVSAGSDGEQDDASESPYAVRILENCRDRNSLGQRLRVGMYPASRSIPSFHPKLYMVEYDNRTVAMVVGSGHPGRGLTINFDHWLFLDGQASSDMWKSATCFANAVETITLEKLGVQHAFPLYAACAIPKSPDQAIQSFYMPMERASFISTLDAAVRNAHSIDIAMFSVGSPDMLAALQASLRQGGQLRLLLDDDVSWAFRYPCTNCNASPEWMRDWVYPLMEAGAEIRFMETNHHCQANVLHQKLMITKGAGKTTVLLGSSNFTKAALGTLQSSNMIGNIENNYLTSDASLVQQAQRGFDEMWDRATVLDNLPAITDPVPGRTGGCL